jgi:hypothetical protein
VIPSTTSSTSPSVIRSVLLPGRYVSPDGSGLGGERAARSTVFTSEEVKSIAAVAAYGVGDGPDTSLPGWPGVSSAAEAPVTEKVAITQTSTDANALIRVEKERGRRLRLDTGAIDPSAE